MHLQGSNPPKSAPSERTEPPQLTAEATETECHSRSESEYKSIRFHPFVIHDLATSGFDTTSCRFQTSFPVLEMPARTTMTISPALRKRENTSGYARTERQLPELWR